MLLYPMRVVLIGCGTKEKPNVMAASWCFPLSFEPSLLGVSISKKRFSHELISKNKEFTVNIPSFELKNTIELCGSRSGRTTDKFKIGKITPEFGKLGAPMVKECNASIECRVVKEEEIGDHVLFVGDAVNIVTRKQKKGIYQTKKGFIEV